MHRNGNTKLPLVHIVLLLYLVRIVSRMSIIVMSRILSSFRLFFFVARVYCSMVKYFENCIALFAGGLSVFRRHHPELVTGGGAGEAAAAALLGGGSAPLLASHPPRSAPSGSRTPHHLSWNSPQSLSSHCLRDVAAHSHKVSFPVAHIILGSCGIGK